LVNPKSTSNQSSKPCTVIQYPSRKVFVRHLERKRGIEREREGESERESERVSVCVWREREREKEIECV